MWKVLYKKRLVMHIKKCYTQPESQMWKVVYKKRLIMHIKKCYTQPESRPKNFSGKAKKMYCGECNLHLSCYARYLVHMRQKHTGERPYTCNVCDKAFAANYGLIMHMKHIVMSNHTYVHIVPNVLVQKPKLLWSHLKIHMNDKRYLCDYCGEHCRTEQGLMRHIGKHTDCYKVQCLECKKNCYNNNAFTETLKDTHRGKNFCL